MSKKATKVTKTPKATTEIKLIDLSKYPSKSAAIRDLAAKGHSRSDIAKMVGTIYQHVNNVLSTPLKRK